jgi:hypothetical protein
VLLACAAFCAAAFPARAENWVAYDEWFYYDADSASYDSGDDIVVVNTDEEIGWMSGEDEDWERAWMAFRCNTDAYWTWSEGEQRWSKEYTLYRNDEMDAPYAWTRDRLCGIKQSLPYRDF